MEQTEFIAQLDAKTQQQISTLKDSLLQLPADTLSRPSPDGGWSISQCIQHLNTYHQHYLPLIKKSLESGCDSTGKHVSRGWLGNYFIKMMDPANTSKYKAIVKHQPSVQPDGHKEISILIQHLEHLIDLLKSHPTANFNKNRVKTSISGLILPRLGDTLEFLLMHNQRHLLQALKNLAR